MCIYTHLSISYLLKVDTRHLILASADCYLKAPGERGAGGRKTAGAAAGPP